MGKLIFGDNLDMLRDQVAAESADLVYLDPPFNSKAQYNVLFQSPDGEAASSQAEAFRDTWSWGEPAEIAYEEIILQGGSPARWMAALRSSMGDSDMLAYLAMMTVRLIELERVLTKTGSLYLHCDPSASHYLKVILDSIFGPKSFRTEISWRRQSAHNDAKQGRRQYGNVRDVILYYTKSDRWTWNPQYTPYSEEYVNHFYRMVEAESGRHYQLGDITGPGGAAKGNPYYEVLGVKRHWRYSQSKMEELIAQGRIVQTRPGTVPRQKRYLDEMPGISLQNDWGDIRPPSASERLGYPTQKPLALLERIIAASSNPGDVILDPFCGCGTTVHAAQGLGRQWVGIDVTHYAISVVEERLKSTFSELELAVEGRPSDLESAQALARRDKYQFQWWANWLLGVQHYKDERKKGADRGIDGEIFFLNGPRQMGRVLVSVKGGENIGVQAVREFAHVLQREGADMGVLLSLAAPTEPMRREAAALGFVQTVHGPFPRLQLAPLQDVFNNRKPRLPVPAPIDQLRAPRPKPLAKEDGQYAFTYTFAGEGRGKASEVVYLDPRLGFAERRA